MALGGIALSFSDRCASGPGCPQLKRDSLGNTTVSDHNPMTRPKVFLTLAVGASFLACRGERRGDMVRQDTPTVPRAESTAVAVAEPRVCASDLPRFADYRVDSLFRGVPAPVDFTSDPDSRRFRTVITAAAARGPNFAGHYTVASWGCGSPCQENVVLDARTGRIMASLNTSLGVRYRPDSRLLIANPPDSSGCYDPECFYCRPVAYLWTGAALDSIW